MVNKNWMIPLGMGVILEGCFIALLVLGNLRLQVPLFFAYFALASLAYLVALWKCQDLSLWAILALGVAFRVTLFFCMPSLSDDIYRYVWDGRVQWAGINPYVFAPVAPELASLRDAVIFPRINHGELPTIYPPVAQFVFWVGYGLSEHVWGIKALLICADLVTGWLLVCLLKHYKLSTQWVMIYFWHPLVVLEIAGSGHIEGMGIAFLLAGIFFFVKKRDVLSLVMLGCAILVKFLPLILAPYFVRWNGRWPQNWRSMLVLPGVVAVGYLPYLWSGDPMLGSLGTYAQHWSFNSPIFDGLMLLVGDGQIVRMVIGGLLCGLVLFLLYLNKSFLYALYATLIAFVLLSPTLHPWYVVWLIPLLVFFRQPAWIGFSLLVVMSYHVLILYESEGVWVEAMWVRWVEFGGLAIFWWVSRWLCRQNKQGHLDENPAIS